MNDLVLRRQDLVDNPTARVPVCLCLDTSYSMFGDPINELNSGVKIFYEAVKNDEIAKYSVEIAVVTFGGVASQITDFCSIDRQRIPSLTVNGATPMGEAVKLSLELLDKRKKEYKNAGVDYFQPWLVIMTDGQPTTSWQQVALEVANLVNSKQLSVFAIGIGDQADMSILSQFSPKRQPLKLKGLNFNAFFEWLSRSVSAVSNSTPGQEIPLPVPAGWSTV